MLNPTRRRKTPIIILFAAALLLFAVMSALTDFPLLDTMFRASADEIHRAVSALTAGQVRAYRTMLVVDFLYAIAYTGLLVLLFRSFKSNQRFCGAIRRTGVAAALAAGLADYFENALVLAVLAALPGESPLATVLGVATTVKWIAVATAVALLVVTFILRDGPRRRRSP
ncbi:MAG: hypothetical protein PF508_15360 [Spirochaeta sp.]|jgi:hypothetical protein|nr:hypothetical protein [Spirochaeta sp.]